MTKISSDQSLNRNQVIVTGSTGFIGSYLVGFFLNQGVNVIALARSSNSDKMIARERVLKTLNLMHPKCDLSRLLVINANICHEYAGFTTQQINELKSTVDEIWHCAAITWTRLDRQIARKIKPYKPYLFGKPEFKRDNLIKIIGKLNLPDFNINSAYLKKIREFAIKHHWSRQNR